jgi:hypothetical protein
VIRCDSREAYDAVDAAQDLARGTLWKVFDVSDLRGTRRLTQKVREMLAGKPASPFDRLPNP